jgi:hypothetical protein
MPSGRSGSRGTSPTSRTCRPDVAGIDVAAGDETYYLGIRERSRTRGAFISSRGDVNTRLCVRRCTALILRTRSCMARGRVTPSRVVHPRPVAAGSVRMYRDVVPFVCERVASRARRLVTHHFPPGERHRGIRQNCTSTPRAPSDVVPVSYPQSAGRFPLKGRIHQCMAPA